MLRKIKIIIRIHIVEETVVFICWTSSGVYINVVLAGGGLHNDLEALIFVFALSDTVLQSTHSGIYNDKVDAGEEKENGADEGDADGADDGDNIPVTCSILLVRLIQKLEASNEYKS